MSEDILRESDVTCSDTTSVYSSLARVRRTSKSALDTAEVVAEKEQETPRRFHKMIFIVEFVLILYILGKTLVEFTRSQFVEYIIASEHFKVNKSSNFSICSVNTSNQMYMIEMQIQKQTSKWMMRLSLVHNVPTIVMSLFLGAYSDHIGRKYLFLLPMCGSFVRSTTYALVSYLEASLSYLYIGEFVSGLCGGFVTFQIACFAFTSNITKRGNSRSFHIAAIACIGYLSVGLAMLGFGYLIKAVGFTIPFIISSGLTLIGVFSIIIFMREITRHTDIDLRPKLRKLLYNVAQFYVANRTGHRYVFLLAFLAQSLAMFCFHTELSINAIFLLGPPMCMNSVGLAKYASSFAIVCSVSTLMFVKISSRCLKDVYIAVISSVSCLSCLVLLGLARSLVQLYIAVGAGCLCMATVPMLKATMSKLVTNGQHGALFAGTACMEAIITTVSSIIGNSIYQATVSIFSGAIFEVLAGITVLTITTLIILCIITRKSREERMPLIDHVK